MTLVDTLRGGIRAARLARAALGVARADDDRERQRARRHLADLMADARGMSAKLGQWLATAPDGGGYAALCDHLPGEPWTVIGAHLSTLLGRPWESVFRSVEPDAHGASLGQVHRGVLHDGTVVAIKIRYPGIERDVRGELAALGLVPGLGPVRRFGVDLAGYRHMLDQSLATELDYRLEADAQERYRASLGTERVVVPRIHTSFTGEGLLVQDWEDGETLDAVASSWSARDRRQLGETLVRHFCRRLFVERLLHVDPHPGNYRFRRDADGPCIVLYDFGCTLAVPRPVAAAFAQLIAALTDPEQRGAADPLALLAHAGFDAAKLTHLRERLPALARIVCAPFLSTQAFDCRRWDPAAQLAALLGEERWWFRSAGPASLLWLTRAYAGLIRQLRTLDAHLRWDDCLRVAVAGSWDGLLADTIPVVPGAAVPIAALARHLRLRVARGGQETVSLVMPATVVDDLPTLIDEELVRRLAARHIDPLHLVAQARAGGYRPGVIFHDDHQGTTVTVELC